MLNRSKRNPPISRTSCLEILRTSKLPKASTIRCAISTGSPPRTASRLVALPSSPTSAACSSAPCRKSTPTMPPASNTGPGIARRYHRSPEAFECPRIRTREDLECLHPGARPQQETVMNTHAPVLTPATTKAATAEQRRNGWGWLPDFGIQYVRILNDLPAENFLPLHDRICRLARVILHQDGLSFHGFGKALGTGLDRKSV